MKNTTVIHLNASKYTQENIVPLLTTTVQNNNIPAWQQDIFRFLMEWFDQKDYILAHTSGSTGKPKEIQLKKSIMLASAKRTNDYFSLQKNYNILLCLPVKYIAGKMMIVRALERELNMIAIEPSGMLKVKNLKNVNLAAMVPLQVHNLLQSSYSFQNIKYLLIGGAEMSTSMIEKLQDIRCQVYETYGMTETYTHIALKKINKDDKSYSFETLEGVKVSCDSNQCLQIDAPHLSKDMIHTNDIVELLDNTHFIWKGRFDNIINSGGVKICPEWVEKKLGSAIEHPFMISAAPDKKLGEKVELIIESELYSAQKLAVLEKLIYQLLDKFEIPKEISFVKRIKRNEWGKIKRNH